MTAPANEGSGRAALEAATPPSGLSPAAAATRSAWRSGGFVGLWTGHVLGQSAQYAIFYALMVAVELETGSTLMMGLLIATTVAPALIVGVPAGVVVDRLDKRAVIVAANLARAGIATIFLFFHASPPLLLSLNFIFSASFQFIGPASLAAIPRLVGRGQLLAANGLFVTSYQAAQLAGWVLIGPPLLKAFGPNVLFLSMAIVFVGAAIASHTIPSLPPARVLPRYATGLGLHAVVDRVQREARDGFALLREDRAISLAIMQQTVGSAAMLVVAMLVPGLAARVLKIDPLDSVYLLAPGGVGVTLALLLLVRLRSSAARGWLALLGLWVAIVGFTALGFTGEWRGILERALGGPDRVPTGSGPFSALVAPVMIVSVLLGFAHILVTTSATATLQERSPARLQGRIFASQFIINNAVSLIPLVVIAALADAFDVTVGYFVMAGILLAVTAVTMASRRRLDTRPRDAEDGASSHPAYGGD